MKKYELKNLDCAGCAAKIEATLKKLDYVKSVSIDFGTSSMFIDTEDIDKAILEMKNIEPDIEITARTHSCCPPDSVGTHLCCPSDSVGTHLCCPSDSVPIDNKKGNNKKSDFNPGKELWITAFCVVVFILTWIYSQQFSHSHEDGVRHVYYPFSVWVLFISIYLFSGWKVLLKALKNIKNGGIFDENFLMAIATAGAFAIGELPEAAGVMIFFKVGSYFQELSIHRSRKSIKALLEIRPDYANVLQNDQLIRVSPEEVDIDSEIVVKPGEKIPLDGEIIKGSSQLDTSALTGESVPKVVKTKDTVLAGMINLTGLLNIRVTKHFSESSIAKILEMVENATHKKAKTEMFFTLFARYYTPIIVGIAILTATIPPLFFSGSLSDWIYRALVILVISCPCALVVSIPLTYFGGIGGASRKGILIKGSSFLDTLTNIKTIVFDKTGTLTKGVFSVTKIFEVGNCVGTHLCCPPAELPTAVCKTFISGGIIGSGQHKCVPTDMGKSEISATEAGSSGQHKCVPTDMGKSEISATEEDSSGQHKCVPTDCGCLHYDDAHEHESIESALLQITAEAEAHSTHPIASSILKAYGKEIDFSVIKDYQEIAGMGISAVIRDKKVLVGNAKLLTENKINFEETVDVGTVVYTAVDGDFIGYMVISDELKEDSVSAIKKLRNMGIKTMQMLSGDNFKIAESLSKQLALDAFHSELLPEEKVEKLETILANQNKNEKLIYVGDGINDAPVLALADVGISMGSLGSDAAIETADIVIMNDSLSKIPELLNISKKTRQIIVQNVVFALGIKVLFLVLGIGGHATMWEAVFADVGVALIAVFNAMRILRS